MKAWFALLGRLLWPSFVIKVVWGLLLLLLAVTLLSAQPKTVVVPLACLMLLLFCIPLQFMTLCRRGSWRLLPHFQRHSRQQLLLSAVLFGCLAGALLWLTEQSFILGLQLGVLAFAGLILPCLVLGHLRPLWFGSSLLILVLAAKLPQQLPLFSLPLFLTILGLVNILLLAWFALNWLTPDTGYRHRSAKGITSPWQVMQRLTRRAGSLPGTLLLGQGDSWVSRSVRYLAYCWYLPVIMWLWSSLFGNTPFTENPFLRALYIFLPAVFLLEQLTLMLKRVRRAWLQLPLSRDQLYPMLERQAAQHILLCTLIVAPLVLLVSPHYIAAACTLLLWPSLVASSVLVNWRLIQQPLWQSGLVLVSLQIAGVLLLITCWNQPQILLLLTAALWLSVAILRLSVKAQLQQLDWGQLKLANLQTIRSGL